MARKISTRGQSERTRWVSEFIVSRRAREEEWEIVSQIDAWLGFSGMSGAWTCLATVC